MKNGLEEKTKVAKEAELYSTDIWLKVLASGTSKVPNAKKYNISLKSNVVFFSFISFSANGKITIPPIKNLIKLI